MQVYTVQRPWFSFKVKCDCNKEDNTWCSKPVKAATAASE